MVKTEQVKDRCVQVVDMDRLVDYFVTEVVRGAIGHASLHTPAGQQDRKAMGVVVTAVLQLQIQLDYGSTAKFAPADHQGLPQEVSRFEILQQGSNRTIGLQRELAMVLDVGMAIPGLAVSKIDLDDPHAAFHQAQRHETTSREVAIPVALPCCLTFLSNIKHIWRFSLHPIGNSHSLNGGFELRFTRSLLHVNAVELLEKFELPPLLIQVELPVADVLDEFVGVAFFGRDIGTLVNCR